MASTISSKIGTSLEDLETFRIRQPRSQGANAKTIDEEINEINSFVKTKVQAGLNKQFTKDKVEILKMRISTPLNH